MALKKYTCRGRTWQIADEDLHLYPGAVPVDEPKPKRAAKAAAEPSDKSAEPAANKRRTARKKAEPKE